MQIFLLTATLLVLSACGQSTQGEERLQLNLQLELPKTLSENRARYARFLTRVSFLEIELKSKGGVDLKRKLPAGEWKEFVVAPLDFPKEREDTLRIAAAVWDLKRHGEPRSYPVLQATRELKGEGVKESQVQTVVLKLALKISAEEYDR